jgi:ubiquinone/menaquinone biosynthesis C-methylase UbiE
MSLIFKKDTHTCTLALDREHKVGSSVHPSALLFCFLRQDPTLPYEDCSFDVVTCVVSIDYMTNPRAVMEEVCRVLKPGGRAIMSISNRCFPTKAVAIWLQTNVRALLWQLYFSPGPSIVLCS